MTELTTEEIEIIESITGDVMDLLGYERTLVAKGQELKFSHKDIKNFKQENTTAKDIKASQADPDDIKRRKLQMGFLNKITKMVPA